MQEEYGERKDKKWEDERDAEQYKTQAREIFESVWTEGGEVVHIDADPLGDSGYVVEGVLRDATIDADTINWANQNRLELTILGEAKVRDGKERPKVRIHPE